MHPLAGSALAALLRNGIANRTRGAIVRLTVPVACGLLAMLLVAAAVGLLAAAFWNGMLPIIGPVWTPVALAGILLALAAIPILIVRSHAHRRRREALQFSDIDAMIEPMLAEARQFTRDHQGATLLTAMAAGIAAGLAARD